jgi:hypothetical protein
MWMKTRKGRRRFASSFTINSISKTELSKGSMRMRNTNMKRNNNTSNSKMKKYKGMMKMEHTWCPVRKANKISRKKL